MSCMHGVHTIEPVPSIMMQISTPFSLVSRSLMTDCMPLVLTLDLVMLLACVSQHCGHWLAI